MKGDMETNVATHSCFAVLWVMDADNSSCRLGLGDRTSCRGSISASWRPGGTCGGGSSSVQCSTPQRQTHPVPVNARNVPLAQGGSRRAADNFQNLRIIAYDL